MRISGTYRPVDPFGDYWAGHRYFAPLTPSGQVDALFSSRATIDAVATGAEATLDRPLRVSRVHLGDLAALRRQLHAYGAAYQSHLVRSGWPARFGDTAIPGVLARRNGSPGS